MTEDISDDWRDKRENKRMNKKEFIKKRYKDLYHLIADNEWFLQN